MVIQKQEATVGYHCPACGAGVRSAVGIFSLSGDLFRLKCGCGGSAMTISYTRDGSVRLEVPCLVCPRPHVYTVSRKTFFERDFLSFACSLSGLDVCYIGKEGNVSDAMAKTEQKIAEMLQDAGISFDSLQELAERETEGDDCNTERLNVPDQHVFDLVRFVVTDLTEEGKVRCRCETPPERFNTVPEEGGIRVVCPECGASRHIDCSNSLFANSFFELESLTLE